MRSTDLSETSFTFFLFQGAEVVVCYCDEMGKGKDLLNMPLVNEKIKKKTSGSELSPMYKLETLSSSQVS